MSGSNESDLRKKYTIVLFILAVAVFVFIFANVPQFFNLYKTAGRTDPGGSIKTDSSGNYVLSSVARENLNKEAIIALSNNARARNGLPPLTENELLDAIAQARAKDMLEKQYFAHVSPTGQQASDIAQSVGYHYKVIAENIGSGDFYTNQKIVDGWMQSPGHRNNILSPEVKEIGAAIVKGKMKGTLTYVSVQVFGLQSPPVAPNICVAPSDGLIRDIDMKKAEMQSLQDQLNRLKTELDTELESIETEKRETYGDNQKIQKINERVRAFNEKSRWFNKLVEDAKAKSAVAESMVNEYNRILQIYQDCRSRAEN